MSSASERPRLFYGILGKEVQCFEGTGAVSICLLLFDAWERRGKMPHAGALFFEYWRTIAFSCATAGEGRVLPGRKRSGGRAERVEGRRGRAQRWPEDDGMNDGKARTGHGISRAGTRSRSRHCSICSTDATVLLPQLALSFVFALTSHKGHSGARLAIFDEIDAALDEVSTLLRVPSHGLLKSRSFRSC